MPLRIDQQRIVARYRDYHIYDAYAALTDLSTIFFSPSRPMWAKDPSLVLHMMRIQFSHRLKEVFEIADRVTVLRDGSVVTTRAVADVNQEQLVNYFQPATDAV